MNRLWAPMLALGLAIALVVVAWLGAGTVVETVRRAGWGVLILAPIYLAPLLLASLSWRRLLPRERRPGVARSILLTWVGLAVNWLLPVGQVGGEVVKARWATRLGTPGPDAAASVVADKTLQVATQIIFAIVGVALFAWASTDTGVLVGALVGTGAFTLGVVGFVVIQRRGMFRTTAKLAKRPLEKLGVAGLHEDAARVDDALRAVYADRASLARAAILRMAFRLTLVIETAVALELLGHPVGLAKIIAFEALGQTVRAGAFLIPGGVGVQEGAFVALAVGLGIPAPVGLAVSLCKRARELLVGVPGLIVWQTHVGRAAITPAAGARARDEIL